MSHHALRRLVSVGIAIGGLVYAACKKEYSPLYFHVLFMTLFAISPLLEMAELVFLRLTRKKTSTHDLFVQRHQLVSFCMQITAVLGFVAIIYAKNKGGKAHLTSSHAVWGASCGGLMLLEAMVGSALKYAVPKRSALRRPIRLIHRCLFFILFFTAFVAFTSGWLLTGGATVLIPNFPARFCLGISFFLFLYYFFLRPYV